MTVLSDFVQFDTFLPLITDGFQQFRNEGEFCDVTLIAGSHRYKCHKIILAANSEYFRSIFTRDFKERLKDEITLPSEIEPLALEELLIYFYSGRTVLTQVNVEGFFRATDYMRLDHLVEKCLVFMQKDLDPLNCVRRFCIADKLQLNSPCVESLRKAAGQFIVENAAKVSDTPSFLDLTAEFMSKILDLNLEMGKAQKLYSLIIKWVSHDIEKRVAFLCNMLQLLPTNGFSDDFLATTVGNEELLRRDAKSLQWLLDSVMPRLKAPIGGTQDEPKSLFVTDRKLTQKCFHLKLPNQVALSICDRPKMLKFSAVYHKKQMLLLCGDNNGESYILDETHTSWDDSGFDLDCQRYDANCVVLADDLYIVGGRDRTLRSPLHTCVKFNFCTRQRETLPPMREARGLPGVGAYANSIYVACGYKASSSVERYDPREGQWSVVGQYNSKVNHCSSVTVGHFLYTCHIYSTQVQRFDFRVNRSEDIRCLPSVLFKGNWITSVNDELYAAHGGNVFRYNGTIDNWKSIYSALDVSVPKIEPWI